MIARAIIVMINWVHGLIGSRLIGQRLAGMFDRASLLDNLSIHCNAHINLPGDVPFRASTGVGRVVIGRVTSACSRPLAELWLLSGCVDLSSAIGSFSPRLQRYCLVNEDWRRSNAWCFVG